LVSWQAKGDMVLQRVNDYWRGPAQFERVTFSEITDDAARVAALLTGRVDLINYVPPADIARLRADNRMSVAAAPSAYQFLLWPDQAERMAIITDNAGQPLPSNPLRDRRVRQALSMAIDRNAIAQSVMEGMAVPSYQLVPDGFFGGLPNPPAVAYDSARARQLLAEAGYPNGFRLPLNCTQGRFAGDAQTCAALAQLFARIGIQVEARPQPPATVFPAFIRREFALTMAGWGTLSGEAGYSLTAYIHTKDAERKLGSSNNTGFSNAQIDSVIRDAMAAIDDPRRDALLQQAMRMTLEEHAIIPIVTLTTAWGARADRVAYTPRADEDTLAHEVTIARR
jgi:peptide/nickel transport system substrate-binding protein